MYHYVFSSYLLTIILINQSVHLIKAKLQSQCLVSLTESNKRENWNAAGAWDGDSHNILSAVTLRRYFYCPLLGREQSTCGTWYNDPSGHLTWPGYWAGALVCYLLPYLHHIVVWKNYTCLYHLPVGSHFYISEKYACNKNQAWPWLAQVLLVTMQMWSSEVMRGDARQCSVFPLVLQKVPSEGS